MNPYQYIVSFAKGVGGIIRDASLILRPNFNDMANLSLTSPSNGSAVFNGSSDYITFPTIFSTTTFSLSYWINRGAQTGATDTTMMQVGTGYAGNGFYTESNSSGSFQVIVGTQIITSVSTGVGYNKWDYVSITFEGGILRIYVNGSLEVAASSTITTPTTFSQFGRYASASSYLKANAANVAVWNRALTSDEINSIMWKRYDLLTAGESTGLVAWYALDDITGTSVPDSTGTYNATAY